MKYIIYDLKKCRIYENFVHGNMQNKRVHLKNPLEKRMVSKGDL